MAVWSQPQLWGRQRDFFLSVCACIDDGLVQESLCMLLLQASVCTWAVWRVAWRLLAGKSLTQQNVDIPYVLPGLKSSSMIAGYIRLVIIVHSCVCGGQRLISDSFPIVLYLGFWDRISHWTWHSSQPDWLASKALGSTLLLPSPGVTDVHHHTQLYHGCRGSSISPTEPSLYPWAL